MGIDISHLKQKFIDEVLELLSGLESDLVELEKNPENRQCIDQVFRKMHTIKGASGMYGFANIMEITHHLESIYDRVRGNTLKVSHSLIDLSFSVGDHIKNLITEGENANDENLENHCVLLETLKDFGEIKGDEVKSGNETPQSTHGGPITWQILFYPDENLVFRGVNLLYIMSDLYSLGKCKITNFQENEAVSYWSIFLVTDKGKEAIEECLVFIMDNCKIIKMADFDAFNDQELQEKKPCNDFSNSEPLEIKQIQVEKDESDKKSETKKPSIHFNDSQSKNLINSSSRINVDAAKLDTLMYLVTELVTTKSELLIAIQSKSEMKVLESAEKIEKLSKLFSDNTLSIRLVSLQEMLLKFQRMVRDLSNHLGKKINFTIKGGDTELDKNIVDVLAEPIMHLIRNCIDHGIELPEKRLSNGKADTGIVFLNAYKSGNNVFVEVGDDGVGIDLDYVYNKAIDQGFIPEGTQLSEKEIYDLIFLPGFSTAQSLTEVSGRGVGMDIVQKKIHEIRGEIFVESKRKVGTTFTIKLQQTISIIDTLLISSDNSVFAIPIEDVEACDIEEHDNIFKRQNNLIEYNEELLPFIYLREKFTSNSNTLKKEKLIVINKQNRKYIIVADNIIGQHQAAVKPINNVLQNADFLSGASILGDGSIALLLDTDKLKNLICN
jgi:two-component system chemotaxis sensor kinase CheA